MQLPVGRISALLALSFLLDAGVSAAPHPQNGNPKAQKEAVIAAAAAAAAAAQDPPPESDPSIVVTFFQKKNFAGAPLDLTIAPEQCADLPRDNANFGSSLTLGELMPSNLRLNCALFDNPNCEGRHRQVVGFGFEGVPSFRRDMDRNVESLLCTFTLDSVEVTITT